MKYVVLTEDDFVTEYHKAFQKQDLPKEADKERFREEVFAVQGAVEDALKAKWKQQDDFAVGWDFNYCYHTCGGIYSDRTFCKAYVETIGKALKSVDPEGRWTYHTVCEIMVNPDAKTSGESTDGTTMKRDWRARLGCPE
jgi:hypothetical protein